MLRLILGSLLLLGAHAAPELERRQATTSTCNADNCFRAVFGTRLSTRNAEGTAACQSFFQKTVSPCTFTATSTVTSSTTFTTLKATITSTTTTTLSLVATSTVSAATTVTQNPMKHKREADAQLDARAVTPVCPATTTNTGVPMYASACSGTARFSSACACAGVTPAPAITLSTVTSTTTITITSSFSTTTTIVASTITMTESTFTSTTTTTTFTSTATVAPAFRGPSCSDIGSGDTGFGSCSGNCYCDRRQQSGEQHIGVCNLDYLCGTQCGSDMDCPTGFACARGGYFSKCAGGSSCVNYTPCIGQGDTQQKRRNLPGDTTGWSSPRFNPDGSIKYPH